MAFVECSGWLKNPRASYLQPYCALAFLCTDCTKGWETGQKDENRREVGGNRTVLRDVVLYSAIANAAIPIQTEGKWGGGGGTFGARANFEDLLLPNR